MKLICHECGEELEFTELDLTKEELLVKRCSICSEHEYDGAYERGLNDADCESEYQEGYDEGYKDGIEESKDA